MQQMPGRDAYLDGLLGRAYLNLPHTFRTFIRPLDFHLTIERCDAPSSKWRVDRPGRH